MFTELPTLEKFHAHIFALSPHHVIIQLFNLLTRGHETALGDVLASCLHLVGVKQLGEAEDCILVVGDDDGGVVG